MGSVKDETVSSAVKEDKPSTTTTTQENATTTSTIEKPLADPSTIISGPNIPVNELVDEKPAPGSSGESTKTAVATGNQSIKEKNEVSSLREQLNEDVISTKDKENDVEVTDGAAKKPEEDDDDKNRVYPNGLTLAILTTGLCLATFVVALDNSIIATAIPKITSEFNSINDVGWYGSSYLLTQTSLQPSFGKIYTYFSIKWTYLISLFIFEVGSVICAAAPNTTVFIVGRAVAGVGASALFSGGMTIIGYSVPLRKRPIYIAALSSLFGIASVIGPLLGGAFTDKATWRWCFWINLPVGGIAFAVIFFFFKNPDRKSSGLTLKEKIGRIDLLGAFFLIAAIVCLLLALQWGGSTYPWNSSRVWGCLLGFGLIISIFIYIQFREGDLATIPPRIFLKQRTVLCACLFTCFLSMALYAHIFFLPFYFQAVRGTSAVQSGIRCIPYLVSITVASIIVGGTITAVGFYTPFMWIAAVIFTIASGLIHTLEPNSSSGKWIGYQILAGFGAGCGIQIPFIAVQVVLSSADMAVGNALTIFFNSLGGAVSISIAQNIFSNTLVREIPKQAPGADAAKIIFAGATNIELVTPPELLPGVLVAYNEAIVTAFILPIAVGGIAFIASLGMEWKSVKGKKLLAGGAA